MQNQTPTVFPLIFKIKEKTKYAHKVKVCFVSSTSVHFQNQRTIRMQNQSNSKGIGGQIGPHESLRLKLWMIPETTS